MRRVLVVLMTAAVIVLAVAGSASARQDDERLDELFARLKQTADPQEARLIEGLIWALWFETGNPETDRLLEHGNAAMGAGRYEQALKDFSEVIERDPDLAEGWNRRATLYYLMGNFDASVADIQQTLAREPRHFGALSGLGLVNAALERWDSAVRAFEEALKVNPHLPGAKENISNLKKHLGRDI